MATVVVNNPDHIEFRNVNVANPKEEPPTVSFQAGEWRAENHAEAGIVVDVFGAQLPLLSSSDARKLAKWLNRAADDIDGVKVDKKRKHRPQRDDDEYTY